MRLNLTLGPSSVFYDIRFMRLFRCLSQSYSGARVLSQTAILNFILPTTMKAKLIRVLQELLPNAKEPQVSAGI